MIGGPLTLGRAEYGTRWPGLAPRTGGPEFETHPGWMKVTKLRIDGQEFFLPEDVDVPALQGQLLAAVREAAGFVTFRSIGRAEISVLMTPHTPVRFEIEEHPDEEVEEWGERPPEIDIERDPLFPSF